MEKSPFTSERAKFNTPEEEIAYLRGEIARREEVQHETASANEREGARVDVLKDYAHTLPKEALAENMRLPVSTIEKIGQEVITKPHFERIHQLFDMIAEKGVLNSLKVAREMKSPHFEDDFHRVLVQYIKTGEAGKQFNADDEYGRALTMTLYEVTLPEAPRDDARDASMRQKTFKEIISVMEQFYSGILSHDEAGSFFKSRSYIALEMGLSNVNEEVVFYVAVPNSKQELFEKQLLGVFPSAKARIATKDYNIFNENGASAGSYAYLTRKRFLTLKTYDKFDTDPLTVILNAFSKMKKEGEGAAIQLLVAPADGVYAHKFKLAAEQAQKGVRYLDLDDGSALSTAKTFGKEVASIFFGGKTKEQKAEEMANKSIEEEVIKHIQEKISSPMFEINLRIITSAENESRATDILKELESSFNQFSDPQGNSLAFKRIAGGALRTLTENFTFRLFDSWQLMALNARELTSFFHFPITAHGTDTPHLRQAKSGTAPIPIDMPLAGTLLGVNNNRGAATNVYIQDEDRMRHFYVIGQTGTGKTGMLKNMITQDILRGFGVCFIDPHGSDLEDILAIIPPERFKDVVYFDPAYTARPMGLNMLEYDVRYPEQKTFVVNELFSIFQKLYGAVPESMGPMFEQYFRNATMLVIEDPSTGNTLLDVSRVLANAQFRELKLSRCRNPIVTQFWKEIAGKAGGDQSLANIVPYITSKFDVFLANDFMRPIIAQEQSSFNFRNLMDEQKIFLVNLSKGRLGDINANLIGLILVGKILMAALSRVDIKNTKDRKDFFLYIDEFQNVTTDSIATILSEARKYRLSLNMAHQFIAQLEDNIKEAVFGNVGNLALFRVGADDAEYLKTQIEPVFTSQDLMKLDNRNAYMKMLVNGQPARAFNIMTQNALQGNLDQVEQLKELSYTNFGRDRNAIEEAIGKKYGYSMAPVPPPPPSGPLA